MPDELGWLIERTDSNVPVYYGISCPGVTTEWAWVVDHNKAIRFARRIDAQRTIGMYGFKNCIATEHMWMEPPICEP